jgi:S-DNA-T family DNA segregation ATPase FtsK/SpoIIIE
MPSIITFKDHDSHGHKAQAQGKSSSHPTGSIHMGNQRSFRPLRKVRRPWREAWGVVLLSFGVYLGLACFSFSVQDYTFKGLSSTVQNLGGPVGARAAAHILGRFGLVGMIWPVLFAVWGFLTAIGRVALPHPKRFLGLILLSCLGSGACHAFMKPALVYVEPSFGYGGLLGQIIGGGLLRYLGYGGTWVALAALAILSLLATDNLNITALYGQSRRLYLEIQFEIHRYLRKKLRQEVPKIRSFVVETVMTTHSILDYYLWDWAWQKLRGKSPLPKPSHWSPRAAAQAHENLERPNQQGPVARGDHKPSPPRHAGPDAASRPQAAHFVDSNSKPLLLTYDGPSHGRPESHLFSRTIASHKSIDDYQVIARELVHQLAEFKIFGEITGVTHGPVVTTFEYKPAAGTKVSKIAAVGEDLARMLKANSLRVIAPIPGKDTVGFEVPNKADERALIGFCDLLAAKDFHNPKKRLPIAMGVDIFGHPIIEDLAEMPHLLVAGSTGSGKSVFMNTLIGSLVARHTAHSLRLVMIDPKMVELAAYNALPHLACPVITDAAKDGKQALNQLVDEMERRYRAMRNVGAKSLDSFNEIIRTKRKTEFIDYDGPWEPMPYIVLIIDEMADMMMTLGREAETPIARLAQKARAAGLHMVIATQRPSADVVTGLIKANFPTRVAFRVLSGIDSRTILDQVGAETLLGKGDMLYLASGGTRRVHGAYLSEAEVQSMVKACKRRRHQP